MFKRTMRLLALFSLSLTAACGGSGAEPAEPTTGPTDATTETTTEARLHIAEASMTVAQGADAMDVAFAADGTFTVSPKGAEAPAVTGKVTGDGELLVEGEVVARISDAGVISVHNRHREMQGEKVVKEEDSWNDVGTINSENVFTASEKGFTLQIDDSGTFVGMPEGMSATATLPDPKMKRTALFMFVSMMAAGSSTSSTPEETPAEAAPAPTP